MISPASDAEIRDAELGSAGLRKAESSVITELPNHNLNQKKRAALQARKKV